MTFQTDKSAQCKKVCSKSKGLTFVEVMITLVVLSLGIVAVFKTYLISIDRMTYLTSRVYASHLIDNRLSEIQRMLKIYKSLPLSFEEVIKVDAGHKIISYRPQIKISAVSDFNDIFQVDFSLYWNEAGKERQLSRSVFISDTGWEDKK